MLLACSLLCAGCPSGRRSHNPPLSLSTKNACIENLRIIDAAKEHCALENDNHLTQWRDYAKGVALRCPTDGSAYGYTDILNADPTCPNTALGHVLP